MKIWSEQKQELTSIELESGNVVFQQMDTTGVTKILNQNCNKYITELKPTEYLGYNVDNTNHILVANNLYYQLPKNWDFYSSIFSNGTGKIALESTSIIVIDSPYEIGKKPPSVLRAVEIIERKIEEEELILELNH